MEIKNNAEDLTLLTYTDPEKFSGMRSEEFIMYICLLGWRWVRGLFLVIFLICEFFQRGGGTPPPPSPSWAASLKVLIWITFKFFTPKSRVRVCNYDCHIQKLAIWELRFNCRKFCYFLNQWSISKGEIEVDDFVDFMFLIVNCYCMWQGYKAVMCVTN